MYYRSTGFVFLRTSIIQAIKWLYSSHHTDQYTIVIMCLNSKNAHKSYPIMGRGVDIRKTRDNRDTSNNALISYNYLKLVCDFKSILRCYCNSEEE
jgi:hypothetical protein